MDLSGKKAADERRRKELIDLASAAGITLLSKEELAREGKPEQVPTDDVAKRLRKILEKPSELEKAALAKREKAVAAQAARAAATEQKNAATQATLDEKKLLLTGALQRARVVVAKHAGIDTPGDLTLDTLLRMLEDGDARLPGILEDARVARERAREELESAQALGKSNAAKAEEHAQRAKELGERDGVVAQREADAGLREQEALAKETAATARMRAAEGKELENAVTRRTLDTELADLGGRMERLQAWEAKHEQDLAKLAGIDQEHDVIKDERRRLAENADLWLRTTQDGERRLTEALAQCETELTRLGETDPVVALRLAGALGTIRSLREQQSTRNDGRSTAQPVATPLAAAAPDATLATARRDGPATPANVESVGAPAKVTTGGNGG